MYFEWSYYKMCVFLVISVIKLWYYVFSIIFYA